MGCKIVIFKNKVILHHLLITTILQPECNIANYY